MKKLLLTLSCAAAICPAFAQDAETIVTDEATGIVTITDDFIAGSANIISSKATATAPSKAWTLAENGAVSYTAFRSNFTNNNGTEYFQIMKAEGAYLSFTLAGYDCQKFTIQSSGSGKGGRFYCYAGEATEAFATIDITNKNATGDIEVEIPAELRAAGTEYRVVNAFSEADNAFPYRMQLTGITYTCTPKKVEQWAAPVCDIKGGSYLLAGQVIRFTCEEGGSITAAANYKDADNVAQKVDLVDGVFTVPEGLKNGTAIKIAASVKGNGKDKSEVLTLSFVVTNGTNLIIADKRFTSVTVSNNDVIVGYDLNIVNFGVTNTSVFVVATVYDAEGKEVKSAEKEIKPEDVPAAFAEETAEITPVVPVKVTGDIMVDYLEKGNYTVKTQVKIGTSGKLQDLLPAEGLSESNLAFEIPNSIPTAITTITNDNSTASIYYNLDGVRVNPEKGMGVLIEVKGTQVQKIVL